MEMTTKNRGTEATEKGSRPILESRARPATRNHNMDWSKSVVVIQIGFALGIMGMFGLFTESRRGQKLSRGFSRCSASGS